MKIIRFDWISILIVFVRSKLIIIGSYAIAAIQQYVQNNSIILLLLMSVERLQMTAMLSDGKKTQKIDWLEISVTNLNKINETVFSCECERANKIVADGG